MPRKKPFSTKQKKKQLAQKRQRRKDFGEDATKQHRNPSTSSENQQDSDANDSETEERTTVGLHLQPTSENINRLKDPNRFVLKFGKESKAEIEERKTLAFQPFDLEDEHSLEKSIESVYKPGSVLDMPKRPNWDYKMSKYKVERNEEEMFEQYKDKIFTEYKAKELSYFECNLETWRQLWRVLEVSDIVIIVTDVRFPILHFSPALYNYVVKELKKKVILLLNKIDLIEPELVVAWKHYFKSKYKDVDIVCFTSFPKDFKERKSHQERVLKKTKRRKKVRNFSVGSKELFESCSKLCQNQVDLSEWKNKIENQCSSVESEDSFGDSQESDDDESTKSHHEDVAYDDTVLTLGLVGHPNVGKSSLLNGLVGKKVVSTSRTPGHTKHFQTIFLIPTVRLCDSPGLVFPSLIEKQLQILSGLYPISQVQEPYTTVGYLAARWPLVKLLQLVHPIDNETLNVEEQRLSIGCSKHPWSAMDVCDAWAEKRGFLTAKAGRNDTYRAANSILRLAVEGKIPFFFYPPEFISKKAYWLEHPDTKIIAKLQDKETSSIKLSSNSESDSSDDEVKNDFAVVSSNPFALLNDE